MRRSTWRVVVLALCAAVVALAGALLWAESAYRARGPAIADSTVVLPKGASLDVIARRLHEAGIIARPLIFRLGATIEGKARALKAGEYLFPAAVSTRDTVALLVEGRTVVRRLTIPEGLTSIEVVELVQATDGLSGSIDSRVAEGSLLPVTYHYSFGDDRAALIERMRRAMNEVTADLWAKHGGASGLKSIGEVVILASIVERETALPEERALVAGVYLNRLRLGMPLQADPTLIYAASAGRSRLDRALTKADLERESSFNTYRTSGLPPAPIANPGRAALAAVLEPQATGNLYFVADGRGGHVFAGTYAEHLRNVARWRKLKAGITD